MPGPIYTGFRTRPALTTLAADITGVAGECLVGALVGPSHNGHTDRVASTLGSVASRHSLGDAGGDSVVEQTAQPRRR